ncbi:methyltransferase domain-containing protein [Nonomuraea sp. NPDC059007]|uniref:methyltransferase domain-containing protein n=1 Tax=Nonomuraea sp. NPDC059007 TaxID=3346692 RepID=UPI003678563C
MISAPDPTGMAAHLVTADVLDPAQPRQRIWLRAIEQVPRHLFVPVRAFVQPQYDEPDHIIDRDVDPDVWRRAVYSHTAIITQRDDGAAALDDTTAYPTSSLSSPHVVAKMLHLLNVDKHHRVLEIGTGSGWTAALLAWRLGNNQVTTVEIDDAVAATAEQNLKAAGYAPTLVVGDGAFGHLGGAPYDRIHVTCGVRDVPHAWVEQTRPGGSIVLPWMPVPGRWGLQLRLDVLDDGSAVGTFGDDCGFMMLRSQRAAREWAAPSDDGVESTTRTDPREVSAALGGSFALGLAATAPHIVVTSAENEQGDAWAMRLQDLTGDGWAVVTARTGQDTRVVQSSARPLWTQLETAFMEWLRAGRPERSAYRMLISPAGQHVRLTQVRSTT